MYWHTWLDQHDDFDNSVQDAVIETTFLKSHILLKHGLIYYSYYFIKSFGFYVSSTCHLTDFS